jgi:hypothetical protein
MIVSQLASLVDHAGIWTWPLTRGRVVVGRVVVAWPQQHALAVDVDDPALDDGLFGHVVAAHVGAIAHQRLDGLASGREATRPRRGQHDVAVLDVAAHRLLGGVDPGRGNGRTGEQRGERWKTSSKNARHACTYITLRASRYFLNFK